MPQKNEKPKVVDTPVTNFGLFGRMKQSAVGPGNFLAGIYNPLSNQVEMNPELKGTEDYNDTLTHEMVHARQRQDLGLMKYLMSIMTEKEPYERRGSELEAFQAEDDRRMKLGLPPSYGKPLFNQPPDNRGLLQRIFGSAQPILSNERGDINLPRGR